MIEKNIILYVRSEQHFKDIPPEIVELTSEGRMTIDANGAITLTYEETELTGMAGTTTCFTILENTILLRRSGSVNSEIYFQTGQPHLSLYETPFGALAVEIVTEKLAHRLNERGGIVDIQYAISVENRVSGRHHFKIRVRESMR